ncbi:TlpA family protein disulfide reductase [Paenibacillus sp. NPDC057967]|uniref:TlpA family protein disulfide reductase n=1 Tax=Paenibacillus sp. NPDC057967 TaxID=3346293 RepID=UPI0036D8B893
MKKLRFWVTYALLFLAIGGIGVLVYQFTENYAPAYAYQLDESIILQDLSNLSQVTIDYSEKPTVLLFFTSWCPYCNEDAPKIVELHDKYKEFINVYGINVIQRDELSEVIDYVEEHSIDYPVLLDQSNQLYTNYGSHGFPSMFFITPNGETIDAIVGSADISYIEQSFLKLIN